MAASNADYQRALDNSLLRRGRAAVYSRIQGAVTTSVNLTIFMRGYRASELVEGSGIIQGDSAVVISQNDLDKSGPFAGSGTPWTGGDLRNGDRLNILGKNHNVQAASRRPLDVGWDLHIKG